MGNTVRSLIHAGHEARAGTQTQRRLGLPADSSGAWMRLFIYYATEPIRLFGRSRGFRLAVGTACIVAMCYAATIWALNRFIPSDSGLPEALAILQPPKSLQPVTRASQVIAPVAVALTAIGQSLDAVA